MSKSTVKALLVILAAAFVFVTGLYILINRQAPQIGQPVNEKETSKSISVADVKSHNSADDCWTIISGQVYDLTEYINRHPGGEAIVRACGTDATSLFTERRATSGEPVGSGTPHSQFAERQLAKLKVGTLAEQ